MMKNTKLTLTAALFLMAALILTSCSGKENLPETITENEELTRIFVNDKAFHTETFGNPVNPAVIIVHGGPGWDYKTLMPLANLSDQFYVIFYNQSGCGLSPRYEASELSLSNALEDLHGMVEKYGKTQRVNLIGHGYGAMLVSAYLGQHPDRVAYAVLAEPFSLRPSVADSGVISPMAIPDSKIIKSASSKDHNKSDFKYMNQLRSKENFPALGSCNPKNWYGQSILRPGALAAKKITEEFYNPEKGFFVDFTVGNERFKNTVLLLFSECNPYFNEESKKQLTDELNRAIYKTVPASGHFMFEDNPQSSVIFIRKYFNNPSMIRSNKTFSFN